jgi:hypothetical protein
MWSVGGDRRLFYSLRSQKKTDTKMKTNTENRSEYHTVRLTPAEAAELAEHAQACGLSISSLIRRRALGLPLPKGSAPLLNLTAWRELAHLASNFNQMVKHANEQRTAGFDALSVSALTDVKTLLLKLDDALKKVRLLLLGVAAE